MEIMYVYFSIINKQVRDEKGNYVRESNTRIVKWSDGTYQMLIGDDNVYDIRMEDISSLNRYVTAVEVFYYLDGIANKQKAKNKETRNEGNFSICLSLMKMQLYI